MIKRPEASFNCLKDLEDYQLFQTAGMKGKKGNDYYFKQRNRRSKDNVRKRQIRPVYKSARSAWNQFCAWCADEGHPISAKHKAHMTQVKVLVNKLVFRPYADDGFKFNKRFLRKELHLRHYAIEAKLSGDFHYGILSVHAWRRSAVVHTKPRVRFIQQHITTTNFYSAGRMASLPNPI